MLTLAYLTLTTLAKVWYEWLVAQELQRRAAILGADILEPLAFWQNKNHEIDFVTADLFVEVKRGRCSPLEFAWFSKQFPHQQLTVVNATAFNSEYTNGTSLENFLLQ